MRSYVWLSYLLDSRLGNRKSRKANFYKAIQLTHSKIFPHE